MKLFTNHLNHQLYNELQSMNKRTHRNNIMVTITLKEHWKHCKYFPVA